VSVLLNRGDGTLDAAVSYPAGRTPQSITTADINGDGAIDVVVANSFINSVSVLPNRGDNTLGAPVSYAAYTYPHSVAAVDLNGDGAPDLAAANGDGGASVLLSACVP
jgi:hypothetical protein